MIITRSRCRRKGERGKGQLVSGHHHTIPAIQKKKRGERGALRSRQLSIACNSAKECAKEQGGSWSVSGSSERGVGDRLEHSHQHVVRHQKNGERAWGSGDDSSGGLRGMLKGVAPRIAEVIGEARARAA